MDMQKLIEAMGTAARNERSHYHLTLGGMIAALEKVTPDTAVEFDRGGAPTDPHSYRGYYSDLSFETGPATTAGELLKICREALGSTYESYKGGDFTMAENTPLWAASYGCCGPAIIAATVSGSRMILVTKDID